jgi:hypothetical protein
MSSSYPDAEAFAAARRDLVRSVCVLMMPAMSENSLAARNVAYHAEELMRWMDAFYSGQDPADPEELPGGQGSPPDRL